MINMQASAEASDQSVRDKIQKRETTVWPGPLHGLAPTSASAL
eukprot:COSAG04_NODE_1699_length_5892_cov_3.353530_8_plen_43_part_00